MQHVALLKDGSQGPPTINSLGFSSEHVEEQNSMAKLMVLIALALRCPGDIHGSCLNINCTSKPESDDS